MRTILNPSTFIRVPYLTISDNVYYLITSDEDLLTMKAYEGTRIIPPHEFVELLEKDRL